MKILLTGASGFIGRNISVALTAAGHEILPLSRSHGVDLSRMQKPADWLPYLTKVDNKIDVVINSVGIIGECGAQRFESLHTRAPIALFRACEQAGVKRVIQISALGADESAFSDFHLSKRAADDVLRSLDLDWFVLRPSLIYGKGGGSAGLFMRLAALPVIPVIGDGQQQLQPIHISDVIATVMQSLTDKNTKRTLDIAGNETITFAEWLQWMRQAQGLRRARILNCPFPLAMAISHVGHYFNPMLQPESLRMLQTGYRANANPLVEFLGRKPLAIEPSLFFSDAANIGGPA